jgi:enoyl-CoA hydratase/carnithine racemase
MKRRALRWELISSPRVPGDNAIGLITINRPEHANSLSPRLGFELDQVMDEARHSTARVVIITGAGGNFGAGGDLKVEAALTEEQETHPAGFQGEYGELALWMLNDYYHVVSQRACKKFEDLPQPTVAAVDGIAVGVGLELAIAADLRIATDRVRFGEPAVPAGFMSEWCAPRILPQLIGQTRANEMILTGRIVKADEAERIGLVNKIVPHEKLLDEALDWAQRIASYPGVGVRYAKETIKLYQNKNRNDADSALEIERVLEITRNKDCAEGLSAFNAKRQPVYYPNNPVRRPGKNDQ